MGKRPTKGGEGYPSGELVHLLVRPSKIVLKTIVMVVG
jgi:hypothetical protein